MFSPRLHLSSAVKLTLQMSMQRLPIAGEMSQGWQEHARWLLHLECPSFGIRNKYAVAAFMLPTSSFVSYANSEGVFVVVGILSCPIAIGKATSSHCGFLHIVLRHSSAYLWVCSYFTDVVRTYVHWCHICVPSAESAILQWRRTWKREAAGLGLVTTATIRVEREVHSSGVPLQPLCGNITRDERELLFEHLNFIGLPFELHSGSKHIICPPP